MGVQLFGVRDMSTSPLKIHLVSPSFPFFHPLEVYTPCQNPVDATEYNTMIGMAILFRSVEILQTKYPDYKIEWSDEGY